MIASLKGTLRSIGKTDIILEVNGVGYLLNVSSRLISSLDSVGSKLELFTDLQVKDDKIVMYGFTSLSDQNFFKLLQSVQGVGPKAAISILSTLSVEEIVLAISSGDKAMIARADGIGPKVAGRVTSELLEKVSSFNLSKVVNVFDKNYVERNIKELNLDQGDEFTDLSGVVEDILSALINLGYSRSDAFSVVMKIKKEFSENKKNDQFTVSYIVPLALKELSRWIRW